MCACVCVKRRDVKQQWVDTAGLPDDTVTKTPLDSVQSAVSADSSISARSSSGQASPLQLRPQLERCAALTLPSASLLMSELLTHQQEQQQQQQQEAMAITGRTADTDTQTLARCASPELLTDITSLLASYQNF